MKEKTILTSLVISFILFFVGYSISFAKDPTSSALETTTESSESAKLNEIFTTLVDPGALEVGDSLISPSSPLYFLKSIREKVELYFSGNDNIRAQRELEFSVRRLREVKTLIEEQRQDLIEKTLQKYRDHLDNVNNLGDGSSRFKIDLGVSTARHMYVLQSLYYNIGQIEAKKAVKVSIQSVLNHNWKLLESSDLNEVEYTNLAENISLRQIAGCQFLALEAKGTNPSESEQEIFEEYIADCKKKSALHFKDQITKLDSN